MLTNLNATDGRLEVAVRVQFRRQQVRSQVRAVNGRRAVGAQGTAVRVVKPLSEHLLHALGLRVRRK
jgi:hypothetical protein